MQPLERWERRTEWPLTAAAVLFLAAYAWPILQPDLSPGWQGVCRLVSLLTWLAFAGDYVVRVALVGRGHRREFVLHHLLDLAVIALPLLRPLRLLRLLVALQVLNRFVGASLRGRVAIYVVGSTLLVVFVSALAVLNVEREAPGATILSGGDAFWWAATTVTTVGYGDEYPVTPAGRMLAVALMVAGIALLGLVTASLASWLIHRVAMIEEESEAVTRRDLAALALEVRALRAQVAAASAEHKDGDP